MAVDNLDEHLTEIQGAVFLSALYTLVSVTLHQT